MPPPRARRASKAGAEHHPAWYYNLRAHPEAVTIEVGGRRIAVRPRAAEGAERQELWRLVNDNYNGCQAGEAGITRYTVNPGSLFRHPVQDGYRVGPFLVLLAASGNVVTGGGVSR